FACRRLLKVIRYEGEPYGYAFGLSAKSDPAPGGLESRGRCRPRRVNPASLSRTPAPCSSFYGGTASRAHIANDGAGQRGLSAPGRPNQFILLSLRKTGHDSTLIMSLCDKFVAL